jgi:hypothetical protein
MYFLYFLIFGINLVEHLYFVRSYNPEYGHCRTRSISLLVSIKLLIEKEMKKKKKKETSDQELLISIT